MKKLICSFILLISVAGCGKQEEVQTVVPIEHNRLMFDVDGDGFNPSSLYYGVYFDIDGNGMMEKMNWIGEGDAWLVYDKNDNKIIDNGEELFSNYSLLSNGELASSGLEALRQYDRNKDQVIDEKDEIYHKLQLWLDNENGKTDEGELKTLLEVEITSIQLNVNENSETNYIVEVKNEGSYVKADGSSGVFVEMWAKPNFMDSKEVEPVTVSKDVLSYPNVESFGTIASLHQAIMKDESRTVKKLVDQIQTSNEIRKKEDLVEELLMFLSNANNVASNSRGKYIDAKQLAVIEAFSGEKYIGQDGDHPNANEAETLIQTFQNCKHIYLLEILFESDLQPYFRYFKNGTNGLTEVREAFLYNYLKLKLLQDEDLTSDFVALTYFFKDRYTKESVYYNFLEEFRDSEYAEIIKSVYHTIKEDENKNKVKGTEDDDFIEGNKGDDTIYGEKGNDVLVGGEGNDKLLGGKGEDIYLYHKGEGEDRIYDEVGLNRIKLYGITSNEVAFYKDDSKGISNSRQNLKIVFKDEGSIVLEKYQEGIIYQNYTLEFEDGTILIYSDIEDLIQVN